MGGERDYKVFYKSRVLDKDEERPQIPTALDPYEHPYAAEPLRRRNYGARDSTSSIGDGSSTTEVARSTTRTSYPVREDDRFQDAYVDVRRSTKTEAPPSEDISARRSVVVDQGRNDPPPRRADSAIESRISRDRGYVDMDVDRQRGRGRRDYYVDDRPRPAGAPYIIETQGELVDVSIGGRRIDHRNDRDSRRSTYDEPRSSRGSVYDRGYDRGSYGGPNEDTRGGSAVVMNRDYQSQPIRYEYDQYRPSRQPTREYDYDREEDWRLIDSMKDTRITNMQTQDTEPPSRSRASTHASEDSYVMVSPSITSRPRATSSSRSAIARTDYPAPELHRRRSRSISFRDSQVRQHDVGEKRHERPGAEAEICGQYLRRSEPDNGSTYDDRSDTYGALHDTSDSRSRARDQDVYAATYRERDEPYGPQVGYDSKRGGRRERSRRRRRDEDDNDNATADGSYYSENLTRTTTRETRYR